MFAVVTYHNNLTSQIKEDYDTNPKNAAGERMLRVLMVGGSSSEAKILQSLSKLVSPSILCMLLRQLCIHANNDERRSYMMFVARTFVSAAVVFKACIVLMLRALVLFQDDLVCGTYVAWDDSMGPLHDSIPSIPYMNLYPCQNPADPNMHVSNATSRDCAMLMLIRCTM
jgi:hypothetical protein